MSNKKLYRYHNNMAMISKMIIEKRMAFLFIIVRLPAITPILIPGPVIINLFYCATNTLFLKLILKISYN